MRQLGPYELLDVIGEGGMGRVWRARDTRYERIVALKVMAEDKARQDEYLRLFRREADLVGRLNSPHIIPIHNYGEIDGQAYLDMRYVPGEPLSQIVRRRGPADLATALRIVEQVASALDDAHAAGVVHRDVKPANILATDKGFVYLADFGIAVVEGHRAHEGTEILGSWAYMAPERFDTSGLQGPECDIYALACVLHFALTGTPPFPGSELTTQRDAHRRATPPSLMGRVRTMTPQLDREIAAALAKDPADRPRSAGRWVRELRRIADEGAPRGAAAQGDGRRHASSASGRGEPAPKAGAGLSLGLILVLCVVAIAIGALAAVVVNR